MLRRLAFVPLVAALLLTSCDSSSDADSAEATSTATATEAATESASTATETTEATTEAAAEAGFPVTLEHAFGSTEITERPERIAGVEWGNHDVVLALGVVPVGMPRMTYGDEDGDGVLPWAEDALAALGVSEDDWPVLFDETEGIAFEQVAGVTPDVILSSYSGLTPEEYDILSGIAPTVAYPDKPWYTSWRDMALINATAMGMRPEAEALVARIEARIEEAKAAHPEVVGKTFTFGYIDPENTTEVTVFNDARSELLEEFGMTQSPNIAALFEGTEDFNASLSAEQVQLIDSDILVLYGDENTLAMLQADPLLSTIPAVRSGAVAVIIDGSPMASAIGGITVLSLDWVLDDYFGLFADAAAKVQ